MAIFFRGMNPEETAALTDAMMRSGDRVNTSILARSKIDKHSTGGIGDKVSLLLAPLVAACGLAVPMISGRGLGITGGTLDKLESIPGYRTDLSEADFLKVVDACGCSIIGQTSRLAPADRKLYALRDVTGTVPSIPLITASIMSKKLAAGLDGLVLDVKCGRGAFMKTREQARELALSMVRVGRAMQTRMAAMVTAMDQPLGRAVGNTLEIVETAEALQGRGPEDLVRLTLELGAQMLIVGNICRQHTEALARVEAALLSGAAWKTFLEMVRLQGGDVASLSDPTRLPAAGTRHTLPAERAGYVIDVDAEQIGRACLVLGAGRTRTDDTVDPAVGISDLVKIGEHVTAGQPLAILHANEESRLAEALRLLSGAITLGDQPPAPAPLILDTLSEEDVP